MIKDYTRTVAQALHEHRANGTPPKTPEPEPQPTVAAALMEVFFNGTEYHARGKAEGETVSYYPVKETPSLDVIEQHLEGTLVLGNYTLITGDKVNYICMDVDSTDLDKAKAITTAIVEKVREAGAEPVIEFSGNKGYHVLLFLDKPVEASRAKAFGIKVREAVGAPTTGDPHVEVFPKQEKLTDSSPMGNLVKLPLGLHPKSKKRSVFCNVGSWETKPIEDPLPLLQQRVDFDKIEDNIQNDTPIKRITNLLAPFWSAGERHNLALSLSGFLASLGWVINDVLELVDCLIEKAGGDDPDNLRECVHSTFAKLAEGKPIVGHSGLSEKLPQTVLKALSVIAGENIADAIVQSVDRIRMGKGSTAFVKVRNVVNLAMAHFMEAGRFVQTEGVQERLLWFERSQHRLIEVQTPEWDSQLYRLGLNAAEGFTQQVKEGVYQESKKRADKGKVYRKFHWDGDQLWVNFGGPEVYKLSGDTETMGYNGEEQVLFDSAYAITDFTGINLLEVEGCDPWELLTRDLSFTKKDNVTQAEGEQQEHMLRALILAMCFPELHTTRPIGLLLGDRGSGKTTASRRIKRFFYGMDADVISLSEDKPDSLRASLEGNLLLALDNLEGCRARWLPDMLSRIATGALIELRMLHKTNAKYSFKADSFLLISAVSIPKIFDTGAEEAVASRLLPIQLESRQDYKAENVVQQIFADKHKALWAGMLKILNQCVASIKAHRSDREQKASVRLADYATFCDQIRDLPPETLNHQWVKSGIESLGSKQNEVMGAVSPVLAALELWAMGLPSDRCIGLVGPDLTQWSTAGEWLQVLKPIAEKNGLRDSWRWNDPSSLGRHLTVLQETLKHKYDLEVREVPSGKGRDKDGKQLMRKEYKITG